jgi:multiple sugar transport system ATP-binding protein
MTVYENMAFGLRVFGSNKSEIDQKVRKAAQTLQLTPLLERLPKALSGGQRQRVAIGRAIVKEPKVFLFDEPLSNLDAALRVQTRLEIAKLHREMGSASMVYVTHDQVEAMTLADKIVLLNTGDAIEREGSVAQVGSPMTLYHRPNSLFVAQFIGSPKMNVLPATFDGLAGDHARVKVANTTLNAAVDTEGLAAASAVSIGVRPEHITLRPAGDLGSDGLLGAVQHTERLGEATLVYFDVGHGLPLVNVRLPGDAQIYRGEQYGLVVASDAMHVFNSAGRAQPRKVELNH